jgi:MFS family permease
LDNPALDSTAKPKLFYGYVIVLVSMIVMTMTFGVNYTFGIFFTPLRAEFGWSKAVTSIAYSILTFLAGFLGIFGGRLTDRFSAKMVSIIGGCSLGLGCVLMSQVNAAWQFYLIYGLVLAPGIGVPWPSLTSTAPKWFVKRRGLMAGIVASGTGFATIILPPIASRFIVSYGWRNAYILMGVSTLVIITAAALFMKRDPHQMGLPLYGEDEGFQKLKPKEVKMISFREMARNRRIWMVCVIYFCFGFTLHTIMVHIVPHAIEIGIPPKTASELMMFIGIAGVLSKLAIGEISNWIGLKWALGYNFALLIAALLWLEVSGNLTMLQGFAFTFGICYGGIMALQSILSAELFGLSSLGVIVGSVTFIYTIGSAAGPMLSSYIFDVSGSYRAAFLICAVLEAAALVVVLTGVKSGIPRTSTQK